MDDTPRTEPCDWETVHKKLFEGYPNDNEMVKLSSREIRKKYPRKKCSKCQAICYQSYIHYIAGDY